MAGLYHGEGVGYRVLGGRTPLALTSNTPYSGFALISAGRRGYAPGVGADFA